MKLASILLIAVAGSCLAQAQAPRTTPTFAVASIRPSPSDAQFMSPPGGSAEDFTASMATIESMIGFAYNIPTVLGMSNDPAHFFLPHPQNLIGEPAWAITDRYDLKAKLDGPELDAWNKLPKKEQREQLRLMIQALLADRFKLVVRPAVLTVGIRSVTTGLLRVRAHFPGPSPNTRRASLGRGNKR